MRERAQRPERVGHLNRGGLAEGSLRHSAMNNDALGAAADRVGDKPMTVTAFALEGDEDRALGYLG